MGCRCARAWGAWPSLRCRSWRALAPATAWGLAPWPAAAARGGTVSSRNMTSASLSLMRGLGQGACRASVSQLCVAGTNSLRVDNFRLIFLGLQDFVFKLHTYVRICTH